VAGTRPRLRHHTARQCRRAHQGAQRSQPDAHPQGAGRRHRPAQGDAAVDREGLTLKLAALSDQIELLPLSTVSMPEAKSEPDQAVSTNPDEWESNLKKNWVKFTENFITIRRRDGAVEALLSPQQEIFLRENLKTKLLQAQLAVYREQQALYDDSLDKAQRWLTQYFDTDNSATHYMQSELDKLKGEQIQFNYPDRSRPRPCWNRC
jgi:uroporphyrin-3 C-methyltransferase